VVTFVCTGTTSCPEAVTVSTEGANQSVDRTVSNAGGSATAHVVLNLDLTAPTVSQAISPQANAAGWYRVPVTVHYTCSDSISGVGACSSDQVLTSDGANQTASGTAIDVAGNTTTIETSGINIDQAPPTIGVALSQTPRSDGTYLAPVTAHFT